MINIVVLSNDQTDVVQGGIPFIFPATAAEVVDEQDARLLVTTETIFPDRGQGTNREGRVVTHRITEAGAESGGVGGQQRSLGVGAAPAPDGVGCGNVVVQHVTREQETHVGQVEHKPVRGRVALPPHRGHRTQVRQTCRTVGIEDRVAIQDVVKFGITIEVGPCTHHGDCDDSGVTRVDTQVKGNVSRHVEPDVVRTQVTVVDGPPLGEIILGQIDLAGGYPRAHVREDLDGNVVEVGSRVSIITDKAPDPAQLIDGQLHLDFVTTGVHQVSHVVTGSDIIRTSPVDEVTVLPGLLGDELGAVPGGVIGISRADTPGVEDTGRVRGQILVAIDPEGEDGAVVIGITRILGRGPIHDG